MDHRQGMGLLVRKKNKLTAYAYEVSQCEPRVVMLLRTPTISLWCVPKDLRNAQLCL